MSTISIDPKELLQPALHNYLLTAIAPRPICFASTVDEHGNVNLSPFSYFNMFSTNPPIMIFSPTRRGRDNTTKHTWDNVQKVPEVVINVVNYPIVEQMSLASTEYEQGINEFIKAGLTEGKSVKVKPPRVVESPVSFECKVTEIKSLGEGPGAGNLVFAEVVYIHVREDYLDENQNLDTGKLDLVARMGGSWYCRAIPEALFQIPKPIHAKGIGVDRLPDSAKDSWVLTGNNLGRLGNFPHWPEQHVVLELRKSEKVMQILHDNRTNAQTCIDQLHQLAQQLLLDHKTEQALAVVVLADQVLKGG
ncbi:flavin reductase family protein [Reichenbachiella agarivorans]|uniref:Flavin reductase family protein n=1 Tax=Reichenbachiella agarivorans TaxID=2979464 RepID=A0ABY6CNU4_9BACT|nr:flavin reductase family protein [Reichenbachiella agarivorans]UXP32193.1 flavin reductase family protein [Reichenbachiella agarivorans]